MKLRLPDRTGLVKTNDVDYFFWNYQFPIKYIQRYRFKSILKMMNTKIYDKLIRNLEVFHSITRYKRGCFKLSLRFLQVPCFVAWIWIDYRTSGLSA